MKTRGIKDLYLPRKLAVHVKVLISAVLVTFIWGTIVKAELNLNFLLWMVPIVFFDLEIAFLLILWFKKLQKKHGYKLESIQSINQLVFIKLMGQLFFLFLFLIVNVVGVCLFTIINHWLRGWEFPDLFHIVFETGLIKATAIGLSLAIPFFFFQKWYESLKREHKLKEENLVFQNETLKNQVNPHFLFNSLNTLSTLMNNEVDLANRFVSKLSLIYRYILDNSVKVEVTLKDELDFIRDYFYMHQIRSEGKIMLKINVNPSDLNRRIMPVSLQMLIENAIKHNMATAEKPLKIYIFIENDYVVISNNIQKMATQINSTKIGLKNLNERVRLTTGSEIEILETEEKFTVKVPLIV